MNVAITYVCSSQGQKIREFERRQNPERMRPSSHLSGKDEIIRKQDVCEVLEVELNTDGDTLAVSTAM